MATGGGERPAGAHDSGNIGPARPGRLREEDVGSILFMDAADGGHPGPKGVLGPLVGAEHGQPRVFGQVDGGKGIHHRQVGVDRDEPGNQVPSIDTHPLPRTRLLLDGADPLPRDLHAHPVEDLSSLNINHPGIGQPHHLSPCTVVSKLSITVRALASQEFCSPR